MARELTNEAKAKLELVQQAEQKARTAQQGDNVKTMDTVGATPTVTMGGILLMRKLIDANAILEQDVPFLHLWIWRKTKDRQGKIELARLSRKSPQAIADEFDVWMFDVDFNAVAGEIEAIAESLNRIGESNELLDASSPDAGLEDDSPNVAG